MLKLYVSNSCSSCRKVKAFFNDLRIPYKEINILSGQLTKDDLKDILAKSDSGTDDLISTRSKIMKEKHIDIDSMKLDDLLEFIVENPTVMKRPIIVDDRKIEVGYDPDEITAFLPMSMKLALDRYGGEPDSINLDRMHAYINKFHSQYCQVKDCESK